MTDPATVLDAIARDSNDLDRLSKVLHDATTALDVAEEAWDAALDGVTESLEAEFAQSGRLSVPEHTAISAARRVHRAEYVAWRQAKRRLEKLEKQLQAKRSALSARQSQLNALRDEARVQDLAAQAPPVRTFGATRAA